MKLLTLSLVLSLNLFAHGDHPSPGSMPPAPHGGSIEEATHVHAGSHGHNHGEASAKEIFYEAVLKSDELSVHPLLLDPSTHKSYISIDFKTFKEISIKVFDARKKKEVLKSKTFKFNVKGIRVRRFLLQIEAIHMGAKYKATVQVERK